MTGVELIVAALAAGAGAGATELATAGVRDAYTGLRDALRRRLAGHDRAVRALDGQETEPGVWQARLGADLALTGADRDEQVLTAARQLLALVDPDGTGAGRYLVDARDAHGVQVGDGTLHVDTNYGAAAGSMSGPVSISYGQPPPVPPAPPAAG